MKIFTSDFFVDDADLWRTEAWNMIRLRNDLSFLMITKRIDRIQSGLPDDWGDGNEYVQHRTAFSTFAGTKSRYKLSSATYRQWYG